MGAGIGTTSVNSPDKRLEQISRVVRSPILQGSEALCSLLKFLAQHSIESPEVPVKEYQIAVEVFGRSANFDPRLDSAVRVQMSRLRAKLGEYYNTVGRDDAILVEIPKGSHAVVFTDRGPAVMEVPPDPALQSTRPGASRLWTWVAAVLLLLATGALLLYSRKQASQVTDRTPRVAGPLEQFWRGVLRSSEEPLVVFSNAEFVGRPEKGLRYFDASHDRAEAVFDHYTGVGEVLSVHDLDEVFAQLGRKVRVKRGRLLNWDDVKGRDVVFLGSPSENSSLGELSLGREFRFERMTGPPRAGDLGIVNVHPAAGEAPVYLGSKELPITEDYAVVEFTAGASGQSILMLAGTTTFGTQGAVEFLCDEEHVRSLLSRLGGRPAYFSALVHVKVQRGVPVESTLAALRRAGP